jgi:ribosomal protein S18 acetylase RimI-like enzyme
MFRPACQEDAADIIPLLYEAIGDIAHSLTGTGSREDALPVLEQFFRQQHNRISYENAVVLEEDHRAAGFMLAYHGSRAEKLDRPFLEHLAGLGQANPCIVPEAGESEYYLDCLAVHPDYRGKGIGTKLLAYFQRQAEEQGYPLISLLVEKDNSGAKSLYTRMGYIESGMVEISGHWYYRMLKNTGL